MINRLPPGLSHMIAVQAARFVGVSHVTVGRRLESKTLPSVNVFGVDMIPITPLRVWKRERMRAERRKEQREQDEIDSGLRCPKCREPYDAGDSSSHTCEDRSDAMADSVAENYRADD